MIRRLICMLLTMALLCGGTSAQDMDKLIRLHVEASDDTPNAQALKLELRDVCLRCAEACLHDAPDADAAYIRLVRHADDFEAACVARARELGYEGSVTAEAGVFHFPDRLYGGFLAPAGDYRALRVTIGEGRGHNWWCILYPGLCVLDEASGEEAGSILNWLRARFGGEVSC